MSDEIRLLKAAGFSDEDIADMSPAQRAAELESARAEGVTAEPVVASRVPPSRPLSPIVFWCLAIVIGAVVAALFVVAAVAGFKNGLSLARSLLR